MSRGPGRVMRAVIAAVEADPHHAVTIDEVCERLYPPALDGPAKKHRVAVARAGKTAVQRGHNIGYTSHMGPRSTGAFYAADDLKAYACAQLKALGWWNGSFHRLETTFKSHMEPGGIWWLEVQLFIAERDGETDRAAEHRRAIERYEKARQKALAGQDNAGGHDEERSQEPSLRASRRGLPEPPSG